MTIYFRNLAALLAAALLNALLIGPLRAETFSFGSNTDNYLSGLATGSLTEGDFTLELTAGPAGALLNEPLPTMLGILSRNLPGVVDPSLDKFDILGGTSPLAGTGESLQFSFNRPGVLTGINFDGVKDESLEYFILELTGGIRVNLFDSAANTTIPGAVAAAQFDGVVTGDVVYLLEISSQIDDEAQGLQIPFAAGQVFVLTYAELGAAYGITEDGNGARLQGISVMAVPEPGAFWLGIIAALFVARRGREGR